MIHRTAAGAAPLDAGWYTDPPRDWDRFVMECEPAHFEQTSWWAKVESEDGWDARYIAVRNLEKIVAGAMALVKRQRPIGKVGYIFRGPLISQEVSEPESARSVLLKALKELARDEGLGLLVVVPPYDGAALVSSFLKQGFLRHPPFMPPAGLPHGTITVDLRGEPERIKQVYRRSLRWEIARARKKGVTVGLGTAQDLDLFWARHQELCRRRGVASNIPGFAYVRRVWHEFHKHDRAWLFKAVLGNEVLCSLICLGIGRWFYAWRIGWAPSSEKFYPTQAAFAQAIQTAAEAGYQFFDFMEIDPEEAARIARGEKLSSPTSGMAFFKMGFGGSVRKLPPALDWYPNPAVRLFMRGVGPVLFSSGIFRKLAKRLYARKPLGA